MKWKCASQDSDSSSDPLLISGGIPSSRGNWRNYDSAPTIVGEEVESGSAETCRICLEHNSEELIAPCECKGTQQFVHRSCLDHWRAVKEGFAFAHCTTCRAQYHLRINFLEGSCWRIIKFRMLVARDIILVFVAVQTIISMLGGLAYLFDRDGSFRKSVDYDWDHIFSNHPILFYYCLGALVFFALIGVFGLSMQCSSGENDLHRASENDLHRASENDLHRASENDLHRASSAEAGTIYHCNGPCFVGIPSCDSNDALAGVLVIVLVVIVVFVVFGIFYSIFAGTVGLQRIWQRHHHILTKRVLTKEYEVEDLHGCYTPPKLDSEHAERLRSLELL